MRNLIFSKQKPIALLLFVLIFLADAPAYSQIFQPEGLNMPGAWNSWANPPTNLVLANSSQLSGGRLTKINTGTPRWQTSFGVDASGADLVGGTYEWLFTSGSSSNYYQNKWAGVTVNLNNLQNYSYNSGANNSITLTNGKWYTMNWKDIGYVATQAIFMETSSNPVAISTVDRTSNTVYASDAPTITISLASTPSEEEKFYLRYSTNNWTSSSIVAFALAGTSGSAAIPAQVSGTTVSYYVFSSTINNPSADYDLLTIRLNNNGGSNYGYTVASTPDCSSLVVYSSPNFPLENASVIIYLNTNEGSGGLKNYPKDIYAHTGLITNKSSSDNDWKYVKTTWGQNTSETKLSRINANLYSLTISNMRTYYVGIPSNEQILKMAFVFRSVTGDTTHVNSDGSNIFVEVYQSGLHVRIDLPTIENPVLRNETQIFACAHATGHTGLSIKIDDTEKVSTAANDISQFVDLTGISNGFHWLKAIAVNGITQSRDSVAFYMLGAIPVAALPSGAKPGINYNSPTSATLVLNDPPALKEYVFALGDFNNWLPTTTGLMNRTSDGKYYWITLTDLTPGQEYAYQYLIDGDLKLADPYCNKVLDPWNDPYISSTVYPNLKAYPTGKTTGIVSVFQTNQTPYNWQVTNFSNPIVQDLVIYELHLRDFTTEGTLAAAMQKLDYLENLGVTAIELMPFNEFEGNDSWGYNPSFYFAPDKAYGTPNDYKTFIDECHKRGIAVIQDMVLNHSFGQSPMVQMYFDASAGSYGKVTSSNPWFNVNAPNTSWSWGFDFNHESIYTKAFVDSVNAFWSSQYKIDGFRYDFTKGFTNTTGDGWAYDASRIAILKRIFDRLQVVKPFAYLILEHLTDNSEEKALADYGMLMWGNMNEQYAQATMGYSFGSDLSNATHLARGFNYHNLISYMESHDEERLMYENLVYGNSSIPSYDVKNLNIALARQGLAAAFYLTIPGPKMIWEFGELGYDFGINRCPNGTYSPDCRTSRKPIPWNVTLDYYNVPERKAVYDRFAQLNRLKTNFPVFETSNYNYSLDTYLKRLHLTTTDQKVTILGNFDVVAQNITPYFQQTGTWYEFFTGEVRTVNNTQDQIYLQPGEYRLYSTSKFYNDYYAKSSGDLSVLTNWGTNSDGTGSNPANFTTANSNYYIINQTSPVISGDWTVSGTNSRIIIGNGTAAVNLSVGGNLSVGSIQINKNSSLTVNPTAAITITKNLINDAGTSGLVVKSNATRTASFIHNDFDVSATVERYISPRAANHHGWHFLSSPVNNFPLASSEFIVSPAVNYDFFAWSESENLWLNQKVTANNITSFVQGKGYLVSYETADTKNISGVLNIADVPITGLTYTPESSSGGWHLLGNPFSSAIGWTSGTWNKSSSIGGVPQLWDEASASYKTLTTDIIPAHNGFMVFTESSGGSLTIPANARVHSLQSFYKSDAETSNQVILTAHDITGNTAQQTIIRFLPAATSGFDLDFDSYFLTGYAPMFYSTTNGDNLALNSLPSNQNEVSIPLAFVKNSSSQFNIQLTEFPQGGQVYLNDLKTNAVHSLSQTPIYEFTAADGDDPNRFELKFSTVGIDDPITKPTVNAWYSAGKLYLASNTGAASVNIYNVQGQQVKSFFAADTGLQSMFLNLPTGVYFAQIINNGINHTVKIIVQ